MQRVNARLAEPVARKLDEIRARTGQSTTDVLVSAIEQYHERLTASDTAALDVFTEAGFVGCAEGPRDLAENAKAYLDFASARERSPAPAAKRRGRR